MDEKNNKEISFHRYRFLYNSFNFCPKNLESNNKNLFTTISSYSNSTKYSTFSKETTNTKEIIEKKRILQYHQSSNKNLFSSERKNSIQSDCITIGDTNSIQNNNNNLPNCKNIKMLFNNYNNILKNHKNSNCSCSNCSDFLDVLQNNQDKNMKNDVKNNRNILQNWTIGEKYYYNNKFCATLNCKNDIDNISCSPNVNKSYIKVSNINNRINNYNKIYDKKFCLKCWNNNWNIFKNYWKKILFCLAVIIMAVNNIIFKLTRFSQSLITLNSTILSSEIQSSIKGHNKLSAALTRKRRRRRVTTTISTTAIKTVTKTISSMYYNNCNSNPLSSISSSLFFLIIFLTIISTTTTPCVAGSTIPPPKIVNAEVPESNQQQQLQQPQQQLQQQQRQQYVHNNNNNNNNHHHHQNQQHHQATKTNEIYNNVNTRWENSQLNENLNDIVNDSNDSGDGDVINNDDEDDDGDDDDTGDGSHTSANTSDNDDKNENDDISEIKSYHYHRRREVNNSANITGKFSTSTISTTIAAINLNSSIENIVGLSDLMNSSDSILSNSSGKDKNSKTTITPPPPCEPKVLEKIPPDPSFDVEDICIDAAKEFAEFLSTKSSISSVLENTGVLQQSSLSSISFSGSGSGINIQSQSNSGLIEEIRKKANNIANEALQMDENLLAFAIASPILHIAVVKFRDNVTIPSPEMHNKAFLGVYWRELGLAWNNTEGTNEWGTPFRDCNALPGRWLWPYRISIVDSGYKIVATAFIAADVDLCNDNLEEIFGRKHGCDRDTTFCLMTGDPKPSIINRDGYTCICRDSYYLPNSTTQGFRSELVESITGDMENNYTCTPCPGGCFTCDQNGVCLMGGHDQPVSMEMLFKASVGSILGACMLCCLVLAVIIFRRRKNKAIATGMWTVLETIVLGILLLYASVALHFLPASTTRCLLEPWCRELGFMTCYGAIILKLYRHLVEFRTRKAHRWVLRDVDLLKYLGTMVFAVVCYMSAFTASSIDLIENADLFGLQEVQTNTCVSLKWEYVTQISEILIICFGLHLAFASRNANTQFRERQFLVAALIIEFIVSSSFYILRVIYLPELSPGAIFLALFIRSQLTNTVTLGLVFLPKLWYQHKQVCSLAHDLSFRLPVDAFKGSHDTGHHLGGGYAGLCLGDPDIGELTISEMSPEDIRAELKRLYTQLEILKNKTLRQDNPHISKRRGGRKAGHRRFSLQALSSKHRNKHHDIEITEAEPSRTPEDSVCSAEGPTDTYAEISGISHSMLSHSVISHSK
ncbi:uncharacterized protein LOC129605163 isoform X2 [Condylostylus longicornis]|uniref:uncharacterized protein LOC129605163 isoform X2 n=1 Tax=Condylostylus longicornis TaxID=2530218 RepID=UPI00244DD00C|nr:uncharacterized protein LOC129605163 isoform X2 [Condylostylus longicornis]